MYHEINQENFHCFLRQLEIIKKIVIPVSIDFLNLLEKGKNYVILTFDDGYAETIDRILPFISRENIPAILGDWKC
jgi:peptidoglycan/xylan/chitin deacetylase (PgdA/CDA1 family)